MSINETTTAIILTKEQEKMPVKNFFEQENIRQRFNDAYNNNKEMAMKAMSAVSLECTRNPDLLKCTRVSLITATLDAASFGLIPNKHSGHAYLIPRGGKVELEIGFKGYVKKMDEEGWTVEVELVTKEEVATDKFKEVRGTESSIRHEPIRGSIQDEDNIALGYAIAKKAGRYPVYCVMSLETILEAAKTNKGKDGNGKKKMGRGAVWKSEDRETDFAEMCKKTLVRRLAKMVPIEIVNAMSSYEGQRDGIGTPNHQQEDVMGDKIKQRKDAQRATDAEEVEDTQGKQEIIPPEPKEPAKTTKKPEVKKEEVRQPGDSTVVWPVFDGLDELCVADTIIGAAKYMLNAMEGKSKAWKEGFLKDNKQITKNLAIQKATTLLKSLTDKASI